MIAQLALVQVLQQELALVRVQQQVLALVRRLVRDMDGRIGHDRDETGGWTHFRLHLQMASEGRKPRQEKTP